MVQGDSKFTAADWLDKFDWDDLIDLEGFTRRWFDDVKGELNVQSLGYTGITKERFNSSKNKKEKLSGWLEDTVHIMQRQAQVIETFKEIIHLMKTEAIADKTKVINAQEKLLDCQTEQLNSLKSTVESTVQVTVQKEIKSYSEAVAKTGSGTGTIQLQDSLKNVVKNAIEEDDRSRNLIVFGLDESEDHERIDSKISALLLEIGEKPRVSASRIGVKKTDTVSHHVRPVKVTLTSSTAARQILAKSRQLKLLEKYKSVFICPDRSLEEREARRTLVIELKSAAAKQPDYKHFIKNGKVHCERKN